MFNISNNKSLGYTEEQLAALIAESVLPDNVCTNWGAPNIVATPRAVDIARPQDTFPKNNDILKI